MKTSQFLRIPCFVILVFFSTTLFAGTTGKIAGLITDAETGEPLIGANVVIQAQLVKDREIMLDAPIGAATDMKGNYFILNVPPGRYVIKVLYIGYRTVTKKYIDVSVDRTARENFLMVPETLSGQEVVVTAEREMVVKDRTSSSAKVSGEDLKSLPVESFQDAMVLQAGVTTGMDGTMHIRGGRSSEIQYYVDGISVSNPFTNSLAVPVENNAIQELEVISGTFNAEYGQAMSGIVNIVTRDGTDQLTGNLTAYFGDFLSGHTDVFDHIRSINPVAQQYYEGSLSGPLFSKKLKFFASGRIVDQENWLFGRRIYSISDSANFSTPNADEWYVENTGDSSYVPMNPYQSYSGQFKLTWNVLSALKLSYNLMANSSESRGYSHYYKLNPGAVPTGYSTSVNHLMKIVHILSPRIFYTVNLAYYKNDYESYVYEDPMDPRYRSIYQASSPPQFVFSTGGLSSSHFYRTGQTYALRADATMQVDNENMIKFGAEMRYHELDYDSYAIDVDPRRYGDYTPQIPPLTSLDHNQYTKKPLELAAYVQDKIEISDFIVNVGLRFDYFNAKSNMPTDFRDPANKLFPRPEDEAFEDVKPKTQLSPRLGLAFPITDQGVIHASYGQFFQIPEFSRLYENPEFEVSGNLGSFLGNADLEPQRTDMYEIGLQQQITRFMAVDVTGFYRDVRNLMGAELYSTYRNDIIYGRYFNTDFGAVRGVTFSAEIRMPEYGITAGVDYTYQVAKGIASDPKQIFFDAQGQGETQAILIPLSWDLRHTGNAFVNLARKRWGGSLIFRLNSGYPFTPPDPSTQRKSEIIELRNSGRYQGDLFMDVRLYRRFDLGRLQFETFVKIENLLDTLRRDLFPEIDPRDAEAHVQNGLDRINTLYDYRLNPASQPVPREFKFGLKIDF